ncbi:MAG: hypothetical protein AB7K09_04885 [Planctomycetota bacterium]
MPCNHRADIFALGVTWYWLVNKRYPISGEHVQDTMQKILADPPVSLSRCLRRDLARWRVAGGICRQRQDQGLAEAGLALIAAPTFRRAATAAGWSRSVVLPVSNAFSPA